MGHYEVITGYDDAKSQFIAQDSYYTPDYPVPYDIFLRGWRSFNYVYILIFPVDKEAEINAILGPQVDEQANYLYTAQKASDEIFALTGVDQFFAWYNRGTSLKDLQDYGGAAQAYDEAFNIYNSLPEDKSVRPYRMLWYQTGPYFAYYYTGRFYDVISLADAAIGAVLDDKPALEESFYWRALARLALGDTPGATKDFKESLKWHPGFQPSLDQLDKLGEAP
jgi:tetratricopeptide (TPR) repeat protein